MKKIPYSHQFIDDKDIQEVVKVLQSDWITQGKKVEEFEEAICKYTGAGYAVAVSSGTAALHLAALASGIKQGDEVITSPITFVATANCILYCEGKPVFADVQDEIPNIDTEEIKKKVTKKTKAIIPIHYSGHPCDMREISKIAKKNNLIVIEDAAHALGAEYKGSKIGACKYSDMTIFSFHPVKHITTGEGGMVLTNKRDLYEKLLMLRNHGITKNRKTMNKYDGPWYYEQQLLGFNYRITDFQCALGISQFKKLDKFVEKRRKIVEIYNKELSAIDGIELPVEKEHVKSSWHLYYIRVKDERKRDGIFKKLRDSGINCQIHYIPVYWHPYYLLKGYKKGICPIAEGFYRSAISIPLYPAMTGEEIEYSINTVLSTLREDI